MRVINLVKEGAGYPKAAVSEGIVNAGGTVEYATEHASAVITWNSYGASKKRAELVTQCGGMHLVMENGYLKREAGYYAVGLNGYSGLDTRVLRNVCSDRFNELNLPLSMWRDNPNGYILVCAQRGGDYSPLAMSNTWPDWIIKQIRKHTRRPIVYRPHPERRKVPDRLDNVIIEESLSLNELLEDAYCMVTHSSNSGHDALLMGVPVVYSNHHAAFTKLGSYIKKGFDELHKPSIRRSYFNQLAHRQFTLKEISQGDIWNVFSQ